MRSFAGQLALRRMLAAAGAWATLLALASAGQAQQSEVETLAPQIAQRIAQQGSFTRVLVADFRGPEGQATELGRALADELSRALAGANRGLKLLPRLGNSVTRPRESGESEDAAESYAARALGEREAANIVVAGDLKQGTDSVQLSLRVWEIPPGTPGSAAATPANLLEELELKIPLTGPRAALLSRNLSDARGGATGIARLDATGNALGNATSNALGNATGNALRLSAGLGRTPRNPIIPACLDCPPPWNVTKNATVKMLVTVNTEGRVTDIQLTETSDQKVVKNVFATVKKWHFQPARGEDGLPTTIQVPVIVNTRARP